MYAFSGLNFVYFCLVYQYIKTTNYVSIRNSKPYEKGINRRGFKELLTPEQVDSSLKSEGTTLVVINSVCGCSAGTARPGVINAIKNTTKNQLKL